MPNVIVVAGEAVVDLVPLEREGTWQAYPGGSACNTAVALARLGLPAAFLGRLSRDFFGRQIRAHLAASGVDETLVVDADEPSTLAVVSTDETGSAAYGFYLAGTSDFGWREQELPALPATCRAVHIGSLAAALDPAASVLDALVRGAGPEVVRSYDPNIRPATGLDRAAYQVLVERFVRTSDLVKVSDDDLRWLYPDMHPIAVAERWHAAGPAAVVVTHGDRGATGLLAGGTVRVPSQRVPVADTVGAGDSFAAALLVALAERGVLSRSGLAALAPGGLESCLTFAVTVSAVTCQRAGADPPWREEIEQLEGTRG